MVKTHKNTGLKYLCQTRQKTPDKYKGSGVEWSKHLSVFGNNIHTEIIKVCESRNDLKWWGRYYSNLWNVVGAMDDFGNKIWANSIPETGGGPGWTSEHAKKKSNTPEHKARFKELVSTPEAKKKSVEMKRFWNESTEGKQVMSTATKNWLDNLTNEQKDLMRSRQMAYSRSDEGRRRNSEAQKEAQNRPDVVKKKRDASLIAQNRPDVKASKSGKNNYRYDPTIFTFTHTDGTVVKMPAHDFSVKYNLDRGWLSNVIRGVRRSIKGWSVTE
jgi:hypothetical protein